jgi:hypothetical protein
VSATAASSDGLLICSCSLCDVGGFVGFGTALLESLSSACLSDSFIIFVKMQLEK